MADKMLRTAAGGWIRGSAVQRIGWDTSPGAWTVYVVLRNGEHHEIIASDTDGPRLTLDIAEHQANAAAHHVAELLELTLLDPRAGVPGAAA